MNIACELRKIYFEKIPFKSLSIYVNILVNYWIDCLSDINLAMCDKSCYIVSGYEISSLLNPSTWNVQLKASGYIFFTFLKVPARLPSRPTVWKTVSDYFCFSKDFIAQRITGSQRTWTLDLNLLVTSWDLGHATSVISIGKTEYEYEYTGAASVSLCSVNNEERDFIGTVWETPTPNVRDLITLWLSVVDLVMWGPNSSRNC